MSTTKDQVRSTEKALDKALEFIEANHFGGPDAFELITAIKQARSAPTVQEPVAWRWKNKGEDKWLNEYTYLDRGGPDCPEECEPLYTSPPAAQRQWVGLTDEERGQAINANFGNGLWHMAKDIEAKLKEKNSD